MQTFKRFINWASRGYFYAKDSEGNSIVYNIPDDLEKRLKEALNGKYNEKDCLKAYTQMSLNVSKNEDNIHIIKQTSDIAKNTEKLWYLAKSLNIDIPNDGHIIVFADDMKAQKIVANYVLEEFKNLDHNKYEEILNHFKNTWASDYNKFDDKTKNLLEIIPLPRRLAQKLQRISKEDYCYNAALNNYKQLTPLNIKNLMDFTHEEELTNRMALTINNLDPNQSYTENIEKNDPRMERHTIPFIKGTAEYVLAEFRSLGKPKYESIMEKVNTNFPTIYSQCSPEVKNLLSWDKNVPTKALKQEKAKKVGASPRKSIVHSQWKHEEERKSNYSEEENDNKEEDDDTMSQRVKRYSVTDVNNQQSADEEECSVIPDEIYDTDVVGKTITPDKDEEDSAEIKNHQLNEAEEGKVELNNPYYDVDELEDDQGNNAHQATAEQLKKKNPATPTDDIRKSQEEMIKYVVGRGYIDPNTYNGCFTYSTDDRAFDNDKQRHRSTKKLSLLCVDGHIYARDVLDPDKLLYFNQNTEKLEDISDQESKSILDEYNRTSGHLSNIEFHQGKNSEFDKGMRQFDKGMRQFDKGMRQFDKGMSVFNAPSWSNTFHAEPFPSSFSNNYYGNNGFMQYHKNVNGKAVERGRKANNNLMKRTGEYNNLVINVNPKSRLRHLRRSQMLD